MSAADPALTMSGAMGPPDESVFDLDDELSHREELAAIISTMPAEVMAAVGDRGGPSQLPLEDADDLLTDHEYEADYSVYENKAGLADDMKFLASMPELCDVTFLVGETREPVCAVKAVLASRSR